MSSGMAAGQPSQGRNPLDSERQRGPGEREQTPEAPQRKPGGPEQPGKEPDPSKPGGTRPESDRSNPLTGENQPNSPPRVDEGAPPVAPTDDADRWGYLPERVKEVFRNQITDDMPVQYRDWIDSYYRRLNRGR
jgi:hypothetical protein